MASFELSGTRVEYVEQGCGEPVLLLHSSGGSNSQWRSLIERLSHRFRVIAPDLYGYGATSHWPGHRAFSLACEAEIVRALLERAELMGHALPNASITIEGASHMSPLTHRDAVNALIAAHLDSHRAAYLSAA